MLKAECAITLNRVPMTDATEIAILLLLANLQTLGKDQEDVAHWLPAIRCHALHSALLSMEFLVLKRRRP